MLTMGRRTLSLLVRQWRAALLELLALPALAALFAVWLWIPDAHVWQLVLTVLVGIFILAALSAVHVYAFSAYREHRGGSYLSRAIGVFVWMIALSLLAGILTVPDGFRIKLAGYWESTLPAAMRHVVTFKVLNAGLDFLVNAIRWYVVPALLFPLGVLWASGGFAGRYRDWRLCVSSLGYWLWMVLPALIASMVPEHVLGYHPRGQVFFLVISVSFRVCLAYVIVLFCWLFSAALAAEVASEPELPPVSFEAEVPREPSPQPA